MSKYLTYDDRILIQRGLESHKTFGEIAAEIEKDRTTVAKEIKRHIYEAVSGRRHNSCIHRFSCDKRGVCLQCRYIAAHRCSTCCDCNSNCPDYEKEFCLILSRPPYVCNGCLERGRCTLDQRRYDAWTANEQAKSLLTSTRTGVQCTQNDLGRIDRILQAACSKGHSLHSAYVMNKDELMCSERTLYNYVDRMVISVRNIDLPRKVRYSRRRRSVELKIDRTCRNRRTFEDFKHYMEANPETNPVQMDSVIGTRGGKVLLTIYFVNCSFMLAFLRDANTAKSVADIFDTLDYFLGPVLFEELFPVILTDNGSEFSNPSAIEGRHFTTDFREMYEGCHGTGYGRRRTKIFYCDPMAANQKGSIEVNHEFIRRILPKGSSFDDLTQDDVDLMMNHINSYPRKKLNDRTPYETFTYLYGVEVANALGCKRIDPDEVTLTPQLLK